MKRDNIQGLLDQREVWGSTHKQQRLLRGHRSLQEGLRVTNVLHEHAGCVNCLEWHASGQELLSSGDDQKIDVWDADSWNLRGSYRTGHAGNVFCVKYVPHQKQSFVTAAADGDVRLTDLVKQEDRPVLRPRVEVLSSTPGDMTLKIEFLPQAPLSFLTTHRDGTIRLTDLRNARRTGTAGDAPEQTIVHLRDSMFFSLCFDPTNTHTFAAGCGNHFVRLYDLRMGSRPYEATPESGCVKLWTDPTLLHPTKRLTANELHRESRRHVTDVRFSSRGDLLVNYADNDVVYFAADDPDKRDGMICTKVLQRYAGRQNVETFLKEVRFLGDENYVTTGSDSGELFIWHAASGELVHRVMCDKAILNGVEVHPFLPTLAVCGIDPTVKILEFRGGRGVREMDSIKENERFGEMSFRQRMLTSPEVVVSAEAEARMVAAERDRLEGNEHFRTPGEVALARDCYNRALQNLKFYPPNPEERSARDTARLLCLLNLAQCYIHYEEWRYAERAARSALQIQPDNVKGLFRLAKALLGRREAARALEVLETMNDLALSEEDKELVEKIKRKCQKLKS